MKRARAGASLVELLVVITLVSMLMSAVGVCLHGMHRANERTAVAIERLDAVSRLSLQFRQDAHQATTVTEQLDDDGPCLAFLNADDVAVRYCVRPSGIERTVWQDGRLRHRDAFRLPSSFDTGWRIERKGAPMAVMEVGRSGPGPATVEPIRIAAAVRGVMVLEAVPPEAVPGESSREAGGEEP